LQAASLLGFEKKGLSFLLQHYCQVHVNKKYQLADWRIRPLPQEMVKYAREDTHYLIYIYERMKQDLYSRHCLGDVKITPEMKKGAPEESKDRKPKSKSSQITPVNEKGVNQVLQVWNNSRSVCLKQYRIQTLEEMYSKFYSSLNKEGKKFNNQQSYALQEIFSWRDRVARELDESPHYVMTKFNMLNIISQLHNQPENILQPISRHRFVHQHLPQLHEVIVKAKAIAIQSSPISKKQTKKRGAASATAVPPVSQPPMKKRKIDNVASSTVTKARLVQQKISEVEMIDLSCEPNQMKERRPAKKINMCKVVFTDLVRKTDAAVAKSPSARNEPAWPAKKSRKMELIDLT
jgi:exosome complex exonuclease RRP6